MLQKFRLIPYVLAACFFLSAVNEISYPIKTQNTRNTQAFSWLINITMPFTFINQTFFPVPDSTGVSRLHIYPDGYSQTSALHSKLIRHHTVPVSKSCPNVNGVKDSSSAQGQEAAHTAQIFQIRPDESGMLGHLCKSSFNFLIMAVTEMGFNLRYEAFVDCSTWDFEWQ